MKKKINLFFILVYMLICKIKNRLRKSYESKKILIIFQQVFGDSVVFSDSINCYKDIFPSENGYEIKMLCRTNIANFMNDVLPMVEGIDVVRVDFVKLVSDFKYFKYIVKTYGETIDTIIVPGTSLSAEVLSAACCANRKVALAPSIPRKNPKILVWIQKLAYTEVIRPELKLMTLQRHRELIHYLGKTDFQSRLPRLRHQPKFIDGKKYCVVCPGASTYVKCWPEDSFVEIMRHICNQYGLDIYVCGDIVSETFWRRIKEDACLSSRVIDLCGKTSFSEWSSLIQYAELVIGNDSATMHIAAAARKPSVCIAGVYDKYQFFPYGVDVLEDNEVLPKTVLVDMECENCRTKSYFAGWGNDACKKDIVAGKCAHCISAITVDKVKAAIEEVMK